MPRVFSRIYRYEHAYHDLYVYAATESKCLHYFELNAIKFEVDPKSSVSQEMAAITAEEEMNARNWIMISSASDCSRKVNGPFHCLLKCPHDTQTVVSYQNAVALDPDEYHVFLNISAVHYNLGDYDIVIGNVH
jgi:hypothetical protein